MKPTNAHRPAETDRAEFQEITGERPEAKFCFVPSSAHRAIRSADSAFELAISPPFAVSLFSEYRGTPAGRQKRIQYYGCPGSSQWYGLRTQF